MKKTTVRDVAKAAGVSPASVSMILNGKSLRRFSEGTIQNVYQACRDTGYVPKKHSVLNNQRPVILIICPTTMNPYFALLIQSMEQEAKLLNYMTIIYTTYWEKSDEERIIKLASTSLISGIVFAMIPQQPKLAAEIGHNIPMVAVGDSICNLGMDTINTDNYSAGRAVASHLIGLGHKNIAYITTTLNEEHSSRVQRYIGLTEGYKEECPEGTVTLITEEVSAQKELYITSVEHDVGCRLAKRCLKEAPHVTAIVAINDMVAYGVRTGLLEEGKRIPEDISLCGFDNLYPSRFLGVELTTVEHAILEKGRCSIRLLSQKITGDSIPAAENAITRIEYQGRLIIGKTTGPAKITES